jgi:hypothetical protein
MVALLVMGNGGKVDSKEFRGCRHAWVLLGVVGGAIKVEDVMLIMYSGRSAAKLPPLLEPKAEGPPQAGLAKPDAAKPHTRGTKF